MGDISGTVLEAPGTAGDAVALVQDCLARMTDEADRVRLQVLLAPLAEQAGDLTLAEQAAAAALRALPEPDPTRARAGVLWARIALTRAVIDDLFMPTDIRDRCRIWLGEPGWTSSANAVATGLLWLLLGDANAALQGFVHAAANPTTTDRCQPGITALTAIALARLGSADAQRYLAAVPADHPYRPAAEREVARQARLV